jgi:hypothetical protein
MQAINAIGIALEGKRAIGKVRQERGSNANVIIDYLAFGKASLGIEHFLQIG